MLAGFSLIILLVIGLGVYNFYATNLVNEETEYIVDEQVPVLIGNQQMAYAVSNQISSARAYVATGSISSKESFQEYSNIGDHYARMVERALISEEFDRSAVLATEEWEEAIITDVFETYDAGQVELAQENLDKLLPTGQEIMENFEGWALGRERDIQGAGEEVISSGQTSMIVVGVITLLVAVFSIGIALITSRMITNPLRSVMDRMKLIAEGDLSQEPLEIKRRDEIGQLVHATNEMMFNSRALLNNIRGASEQVNSESESLTSFADNVMTGSEQVASTMEDLASGSESQAQHAGSLSTMMSQFTTQVEEANNNGEHIQQASHQVLEMTNEGTRAMEQSSEQMTMIDQIVQDAVEKVEGLDAHSKEISELVLVIQDIAEQTNLLALNAAIEAARAGEHGQGFAVVADEVRKLAEEVSMSVTDITDIVDRIQGESSTVTHSLRDGYHEVAEGTIQIQTTHETFQQISAAVEEMVNHINVVSRNLEDITSNTQEMGSSIEEIAAISEESAAGIEQTSAQSQQASSAMQEVAGSSRHLTKLAEELDGFVRRFKV